MKFKVVLEPSDEGGFTVHVPALPGCVSEGDTEDEALRNIKEAIELYLEPAQDEVIRGEKLGSSSSSCDQTPERLLRADRSSVQRDGWVVIRQRGSHIRLEKRTEDRTWKLTVPAHRPVKRSTLSHILKQANITAERFLPALVSITPQHHVWACSATGAPWHPSLAPTRTGCPDLSGRPGSQALSV